MASIPNPKRNRRRRAARRSTAAPPLPSARRRSRPPPTRHRRPPSPLAAVCRCSMPPAAAHHPPPAIVCRRSTPPAAAAQRELPSCDKTNVADMFVLTHGVNSEPKEKPPPLLVAAVRRLPAAAHRHPPDAVYSWSMPHAAAAQRYFPPCDAEKYSQTLSVWLARLQLRIQRENCPQSDQTGESFSLDCDVTIPSNDVRTHCSCKAIRPRGRVLAMPSPFQTPRRSIVLWPRPPPQRSNATA